MARTVVAEMFTHSLLMMKAYQGKHERDSARYVGFGVNLMSPNSFTTGRAVPKYRLIAGPQ